MRKPNRIDVKHESAILKFNFDNFFLFSSCQIQIKYCDVCYLNVGSYLFVFLPCDGELDRWRI